MLRSPDEPACTTVQLEPPSLLRINEPFAVPTRTTWLLSGLTAIARTALFPPCGRGGSFTHVEGARETANTAMPAQAKAVIAASVAARRLRGSDTSGPIITQPPRQAAPLVERRCG